MRGAAYTYLRAPILQSARFRACREQVVLHAEEGRPGSSRDAELAVDVLDVVPDGARREVQLAGHLLVGVAAGEQAQNLDLAARETGRPLPPSRPDIALRQDGLHDRAVEPACPDLLPELVRRRPRLERRA